MTLKQLIKAICRERSIKVTDAELADACKECFDRIEDLNKMREVYVYIKGEIQYEDSPTL